MMNLNATIIPLPLARKPVDHATTALPWQRIALSHLAGTRYVPLSEIMFITASGAYSLIKLCSGEQIMVSKPLSRFETKVAYPQYLLFQ
jgi:hypothetical protein